MKFLKTRIALLLMSMAFSSVSVAGEFQWKGQRTVVEGVVHVSNPSEPVEGTHVMRTQLVWSVGEEDTGDVVFGDIISAARDRAGNTYLLDEQQAKVYAIAPGGGFLGTRGGPGEGPSEFGPSCGLTVLEDTLLCVTQMMPPRVVLMNLDGRSAGDYPLSHELDAVVIFGSAPSRGGLALFLGEYIQKVEEHAIGMRSFICQVDRKGDPLPACWEMMQESDLTDIEFNEKIDGPPVWAVSPAGRAFVSKDWDAYEIESVDVDGQNRMVFGRAYQPIARAQWQLELNGKRIEKKEMSPDTRLSETGRTIVQIFPRDDGGIWVLSDRGENGVADGVVAEFDVFDPEGRFVRRERVPGEYQAGRDRLFLVDDYLYVVVNGGELGGDPIFSSGGEASDTMEVQCLALEFPQRTAGAR